MGAAATGEDPDVHANTEDSHEVFSAEAVEKLEAGLRDAKQGGDRRAILRARHELGRALLEAGDLDRAMVTLAPLPGAFLLLPEPDRRGLGEALTGLGQAYLRRGRPVSSINFFGQALEAMRAVGDVERQGDMFVHLAAAAHRRQDPAAETAALERARELYASVSSPKAGRVVPPT